MASSSAYWLSIAIFMAGSMSIPAYLCRYAVNGAVTVALFAGQYLADSAFLAQLFCDPVGQVMLNSSCACSCWAGA